MSKGKHRTYPNENNDKTKQLRKKIKDQEKEILRLKSELKTLNKAFEKTATYIKGNSDNVSVEKIIEGVKAEKTLVEIQIENKCPSCEQGQIKSSRLPFGRIEICSVGCGYRNVINEDN